MSDDPATNEVLSEQHYYPSATDGILGRQELSCQGAWMQNPGKGTKYCYNGKELNEDFGLDWHDYGARWYDASIGRWNAVDLLSEMYQTFSPYIYVLNRPTVAKDPDGKLVIFINGNHYGSGGKPSYWREYGKRLVVDRKASQWLDPGEYHYEQYEIRAFDREIMSHLNDYNAIYIDGSLGGGAPLNFNGHTSAQTRYNKGYDKGMADAAQIIEMIKDENGNIVETIKVMTHSMGGIFGKGYVKALKEYIKSKGLEKEALIELIVDFDPYQAGHSLGSADPNTYTMQFSNTTAGEKKHLTGRLANQMQNGVDFPWVNSGPGSTSSHYISAFFNNISQVKPGTYIWDEENKEWVCTNCK